jgi:hypothetical protein
VGKLDMPDGDTIDISPSPEMMNVARISASDMTILPQSPPAGNSSFKMQFYGPSVECSSANATQQPYFDYYLRTFAQQEYTASNLTLANSETMPNPSAFFHPNMLMSSIFDPFGYYEATLNKGFPDRQSNTCNVSLGEDFIDKNSFSLSEEEFDHALFFQPGWDISSVLMQNKSIGEIPLEDATKVFAP